MTKIRNKIFFFTLGSILSVYSPNGVVANLRDKRLVTFSRSAPARIQVGNPQNCPNNYRLKLTQNFHFIY